MRAGCGGGTWRPGALEIHQLAIGQADSALIVGPTGRTLLVDLGETGWESTRGATAAGAYLERTLGCRRLDYVLVTHFHLDHLGYVGKGGLWHLVNVQGFQVGKLLHRDGRAFLGDSGRTYELWRDYLAGEGAALFHPELVRAGAAQVDLGPGLTVTIVGADGQGALASGDFSRGPLPPSENDYSVAGLVRFGAFDYFFGGDLSGEHAVSDFGYSYHDVETQVARRLPDVDVYRVNHHGSDHSSNATFLAQIDPEVSILSLGDGNSYQHPRPRLMERLLATSAVYLTARGELATEIGAAMVEGAIVVRTTDGHAYTVNGDHYVAGDPARIDGDGDGYFREADPDDGAADRWPALNGGCDPMYQRCAGWGP